MIYVVEREDGTPLKIAGTPRVAAYALRSSAKRAAVALRGRVVEYTVTGTGSDGSGTSEVLAREVTRLRAEADGARASLADHMAGNRALRALYGVQKDETMHAWIGRLHREAGAARSLVAAARHIVALDEGGR